MAGKLYVVGTPIGNLGDMSPRAVEVLDSVDFIAAEDTRVTVKLLNHFGIKKPMVSYHEHNKASQNEKIADRIQMGETCALVTDAGMPAISDPGEDLVRYCRERELEIESVPGPSALITALAISGMPSKRFSFEGFLSVEKKERDAHLESLRSDTHTLIFYEAPHKLTATLRDMLKYFGDRKIAIVKELTKLHENCELTTLAAACEKYSAEAPRGEFVLIVSGAEPKDTAAEYTLESAVEMAKGFIADGMSPTAAAKSAAGLTGFRRNEIYKNLI
jgi:16S rRNA (cytidine1402-2'-O)-methyltransferase